MDFYNNPAKPCTPPLILIWDFYWLLKKLVLKVSFMLNGPLEVITGHIYSKIF